MAWGAVKHAVITVTLATKQYLMESGLQFATVEPVNVIPNACSCPTAHDIVICCTLVCLRDI